MNLTAEPLVTVLTPVYNGEKYLSQCIESVLAQTYQNWEYVIINNRSTDRSLEIARSYSQRNPRIRIHNNTAFVGIIRNHNIGFQQLSQDSKYCKVVHADDWLFPDCLTQMVKVAEANPSIGIVGAYRLDGIKVNLDGLPYPSPVVPGRQICRKLLLEGIDLFGSPTSILFRSDVIRRRKEFFDESSFSVHVDTAACYDVLQSADFGFVHQVLTYTRRHSEAETSHSVKINTYISGALLCLRKYGPFYLSCEEYEERLERLLNSYYRFLGEAVFQMRDKQFWEYHSNALRTLGCPLSTSRLLKATFWESANLIRHPVDTFRRAIQFVRKRKVLLLSPSRYSAS